MSTRKANDSSSTDTLSKEARQRETAINVLGKKYSEQSRLQNMVLNFVVGVAQEEYSHILPRGARWVPSEKVKGIEKSQAPDWFLMKGRKILAINETKGLKTGTYAPLGPVEENLETGMYSGHWTGPLSGPPQPSPREKGTDVSNAKQGRILGGESSKFQFSRFFGLKVPAFATTVSNLGERTASVQVNTMREMLRFTGAMEGGRQNQKTKPDVGMKSITMLMRYAQPETVRKAGFHKKTGLNVTYLETGTGLYKYTPEGKTFVTRGSHKKAKPGDVLDPEDYAYQHGALGASIGGIPFIGGGGKTLTQRLANFQKQLYHSDVAKMAALSLWRSEDYRVTRNITTQDAKQRAFEKVGKHFQLHTFAMTQAEYQNPYLTSERERKIASTVNILGKGGVFALYRKNLHVASAAGRLIVSALPLGGVPRQIRGSQKSKQVIVKPSRRAAGYRRSKPE